MKRILTTILTMAIVCSLSAQVNLKYINIADSLQLRGLESQETIFLFDSATGITFPDGTVQNTAALTDSSWYSTETNIVNVDTIKALTTGVYISDSLTVNSNVYIEDTLKLNGAMFAYDLDTIQNEYTLFMNPTTKEITAREVTHLFGYFDNESINVSITQNVWNQVTNATNDLFTIVEATNIGGANDTVKILQHGDYLINFHLQIEGSNGDVYEIRIYNATQDETVVPMYREETGGAGDTKTLGGVVYCTNCNEGDELVFEYRNITGNDNVVIISGTGFMEMIHAE